MHKMVLFFMLIGGLLAAGQIFAQAPTPDLSGTPGIQDLSIQKLLEILTRFACWTTQIAMFIVVIFVIYYGFLFLKSQGDPTKVTEARKAILWGIVGIAVILGTYTIIATVSNAISGTDLGSFPIGSCSGYDFTK